MRPDVMLPHHEADMPVMLEDNIWAHQRLIEFVLKFVNQEAPHSRGLRVAVQKN